MTWPTFISIAQKVSKSLLLVKREEDLKNSNFLNFFPLSHSHHMAEFKLTF